MELVSHNFSNHCFLFKGLQISLRDLQDIILIRILRFKGSVAALNKKFYFWRPQVDAKFLCMLSLGSTCLLLVRAYNLLLTHFFFHDSRAFIFKVGECIWPNACTDCVNIPKPGLLSIFFLLISFSCLSSYWVARKARH